MSESALDACVSVYVSVYEAIPLVSEMNSHNCARDACVNIGSPHDNCGMSSLICDAYDDAPQ